MTVDVVDATGLVAGHDAVSELAEAVLAAEGVSGEVSVAFVDEAAIADLNSRYRDADGPTDVLSFDYSDEDHPARGHEVTGAATEVAGEIVVCPQVVMRYAAEEGREPAVQLGWTIIHGVLHLAGYDHETDRGKMRAREQELLRRLNGPVRALSLAEAGE